MTTRPYDDCLTLTLALCGIPDANTVEVARINAFMNGRARRAYAACRYWPRYLKVEERVCSEDGILPYEQDGLDTIKEVLRVHATEPYQTEDALEYPNYAAMAGGVQITSYQASAYTGYANILVTGSVIPESDGEYAYIGQSSPGLDGVTTAPRYERADNTNYVIEPSLFFTLGGTFQGYTWNLGWFTSGNFWQSDNSPDYTTPDLATGNYTPQGFASGTIEVSLKPTYSVWVTYKAAFTETYSTGGEIPEEWADYIIYGSYADWLRSEGQQDKAILAEQEARPYLDDQLEVLDRQSGSHVFTRVLNHSNMQPR